MNLGRLVRTFCNWVYTKSVITGRRDNVPYMTRRVFFNRLRFHSFHRGDEDPDHHDHPFNFWTFPLNTYVEEWSPTPEYQGGHKLVRLVRAWRIHYRPAEFTHRVLGRWTGEYEKIPYRFPITGEEFRMGNPLYEQKPIRTIVWQGRRIREWGFWKHGSWIDWKTYLGVK